MYLIFFLLYKWVPPIIYNTSLFRMHRKSIEYYRVLFELDVSREDFQRYTLLSIVGAGAYGVVFKAQDVETQHIVAMKKVFNIFDAFSDSIRVLRELKFMKLFRHPNIVSLIDICVPSSESHFNSIYVVMQNYDADLSGVIKENNGSLEDGHYKYILVQILSALKYLHSANILHRDIKPHNILINKDCQVCLCDFGLSKMVLGGGGSGGGSGRGGRGGGGSGGGCGENNDIWTNYVVTRWYRAPELCSEKDVVYSNSIDIWGVGCILGEMVGTKAMFPGKNNKGQLCHIFDVCGAPDDDVLSAYYTPSEKMKFQKYREKYVPLGLVALFDVSKVKDMRVFDLLEKMLSVDPSKRFTVDECLAHPYLEEYLGYAISGEAKLSIDANEFSFEKKRGLDIYDVRRLIWKEILLIKERC